MDKNRSLIRQGNSGIMNWFHGQECTSISTNVLRGTRINNPNRWGGKFGINRYGQESTCVKEVEGESATGEAETLDTKWLDKRLISC